MKDLHVWYSKHIESETMQKVLYFSPSRFFSFHRTWLNNKNILFIIKQCLDRWILKLWLTDWAQGKLWRVATLSSDLIQDSNVYICSEVVDSSLKIWITEIKVVTKQRWGWRKIAMSQWYSHRNWTLFWLNLDWR